MSSERVLAFGDELERAVSVVSTLPAITRLAAFGFDVLSRQAEGKSMFAGKKFAAGRAEAHGVRRTDAETPFGNVLSIVERGAGSAAQQALLAALFVRGFGDAVAARPADRESLVARFAAHCEWLELSASERVWPLLPELLSATLASEVHASLGALTLREGTADGDPRGVARMAGRIALLADAGSDPARIALERIAANATDDFVRAMCGVALGDGNTTDSTRPPYVVHGHSGPRVYGPVLTLLSWVTGVALLSWVGRAILLACGYQRQFELWLRGEALRVRSTTRLLGRQVQHDDRVHAVADLRSARRTGRYPVLHVALGTLCFSLGILIGGAIGFDALRAGEPALLRWSALWVLAGCAIDFMLSVVIPGQRGRVAFELDLGRGRRVRVTGVPMAEADRLLEALWRKLERPRRKDARAVS